MTMFFCVSCGEPLDSEGGLNFSHFHQVTSDCRLFGSGGQVLHCAACGLVQRPRSRRWREDCAEIYLDYQAHRQGRGEEQKVFNSSLGQSRSDGLISHISGKFRIGDHASWLDYGCGEGHFLESLSQHRPDVALSGCDHTNEIPQRLRNQDRIKYFPVGSPFRARFDWISLIHVVEHFHDPRNDLRRIQQLLKPGGRIFIQVPDLDRNPFDLIIADHGSFFTKSTICQLLQGSGLDVELCADDWVRKELSIIATQQTDTKHIASLKTAEEPQRLLEHHLKFLTSLKSEIRSNKKEKITIFGSSIAATWAAAERGVENVHEFLDEDSSRQNAKHLGVPVRKPTPGLQNVIIPLDLDLQKKLKKKYRY